ncbi:DEKNAAC100555 [Brettanomyces naardenensis]|uniref:Glycerol-3-phosphate dehydrogenase [NAD(+)] n=1 Tax=Brettanomyces naardenensis TaxID=13370 RepID=A0A448YF64_BRENA|nr:DEKNAAC100555 [Brettanomyces naardenensis]
MTAFDRLSNISNVLAPPASCSTVQSEDIPEKPYKATVVGSGNWGSTIAKVVAENCIERPQEFDQTVCMWVFEERIKGEKLTEIINTRHENVKYLPGILLPANVVAVPDIVEACKDADIIIFNIPHQFLGNILRQLKGKVNPNARAISCLKGLNVSREGCDVLADVISRELGINCGALSGANLAPEVAQCKWSETTVAYHTPADFRGKGKDIDKKVLKHLFHRPYFHVHVIDDVSGISLAGALKNVVAMAAGFVDGLGWGNNAKSAVMRLGLREMIHFAKLYFPECEERTFTEESAGVADLITTCFGGRNVRVGKYMAEHHVPAEDAEKVLLNGQSCQGIFTTKEVYEFLSQRDTIDEFPLFHVTYDIIYNGFPMEKLPERIERGDEKY